MDDRFFAGGARATSVAALLVAAGACGSEPAPEHPRDAGAPPAGCAPGELTLETGDCRPAGVSPEMCGPGFEPSGDAGCNPILPARPCPPGEMAVVGEDTCRAVAPCDGGDWGSAPIDAATQHVQHGYGGADSDGTEARPWPTIQEGVDAAAPGAVVAIAAGTYEENVVVAKRIKLWGRCPELVEVAGLVSGATGAILVKSVLGAEVHDLAVRSAGIGIVVEGAQGAVLERLRVHDTASFGIGVRSDLGPTDVVVRGTLVEGSKSVGVFVLGSVAALEGVVVRDAGARGLGVQVEPSSNRTSDVKVTGSLFERNRDEGMFISDATATIEATVVRDTLLLDGGYGIHAFGGLVARSNVTIRTSVIERSESAGIVLTGSDGTVDATVVRDSTNTSDFGVGVYATEGSTLTLSSSTVERATTAGVVIQASDATIESTLVRDTLPQPSDGTNGWAIGFEEDLAGTRGSGGAVRGCVVEHALTLGVGVSGSHVSIESTAVRETGVAASDGSFGDGLFVEAARTGASLAVTGSLVEASARAGISNFSSEVSLESTRFECNPISIDGETDFDAPYTFVDLGDNLCGCQAEAGTCAAVTSGLTPPAPLGGKTD